MQGFSWSCRWEVSWRTHMPAWLLAGNLTSLPSVPLFMVTRHLLNAQVGSPPEQVIKTNRPGNQGATTCRPSTVSITESPPPYSVKEQSLSSVWNKGGMKLHFLKAEISKKFVDIFLNHHTREVDYELNSCWMGDSRDLGLEVWTQACVSKHTDDHCWL